MTAKTISIVNRKGGVGKTSSAFHIGGHLAELNQNRVLLIDNDPQHSLSSGLLGVHEAANLRADCTIAALYDESCLPDERDLIHETEIPNLHLLAGSDSLAYYNLPNVDQTGPLQLVLKEFIETISDDYDYVIIDNPPNLQLCSVASLVAADAAICITQSEDFGSQGGVAVQAAVSKVQQSINPQLQFLGYVLNLYDRRLIVHQAFSEALRKEYGDLVFETVLPLAVHFKESISARCPVTIYKPRCVAAEAVRNLTTELLQKLEPTQATKRKTG